MSVNLSAPAIPLRLKRVDCDESQNTHALKCKRRRLSQPPSPGLAPCLRPQTPSTEQTGPEKVCVSSIGPYVLLEATEGTQTYRAVHRVTEQEHTCKVSSLSFNMILGISVSIATICLRLLKVATRLLNPNPHQVFPFCFLFFIPHSISILCVNCSNKEIV